MTLESQLKRALDDLSERLRDEVTRHVHAIGQELARDAAPPSPPAPPAPAGPSVPSLLDGIRALDAAASLTGILDALMNAAAADPARAAILLPQGDHFKTWRLRGFGSLDAGEPAVLPAGDAGIVGDAARTGQTVTSTGAAPSVAPAFARLPRGRSAIALPILISGQAVAVLYADAGDAADPAALDPAALEIVTRHASRCLESLTATLAARSLSGRVWPTPGGRAPAGPAAAAPGAPLRDDDHAAARRYARLLVSEIKLYHEAEVAAGRRERNLAARLGDEIARARALYDQRVPADVRQSSDYVLEELIRTLADGDASLLEAAV